MGIQIEDGKGSGLSAEVIDNKLKTLAVASSICSNVSIDPDRGEVYTVIGTATVASGTVIPLFIKNDDNTKLLIFDRIYVQGVSITGGTAIPNSNAYFSLGFGRTFSAGGSDVTPVNQNRTSTKEASVTVKDSDPTLTGTFVESTRWYIEDNGKAFDMIGARSNDTALGRSHTFEVRYTSDNTAGTVMAIAKFFFVTPSEIT